MMLSSGAEIDQEIKAMVDTAPMVMEKHVSTVEGLTIEVIVLHLVRNAKSMAGTIILKSYVKVETLIEENLVTQDPKKVRGKRKKFMR